MYPDTIVLAGYAPREDRFSASDAVEGFSEGLQVCEITLHAASRRSCAASATTEQEQCDLTSARNDAPYPLCAAFSSSPRSVSRHANTLSAVVRSCRIRGSTQLIGGYKTSPIATF